MTFLLWPFDPGWHIELMTACSFTFDLLFTPSSGSAVSPEDGTNLWLNTVFFFLGFGENLFLFYLFIFVPLHSFSFVPFSSFSFLPGESERISFFFMLSKENLFLAPDSDPPLWGPFPFFRLFKFILSKTVPFLRFLLDSAPFRSLQALFSGVFFFFFKKKLFLEGAPPIVLQEKWPRV